MQENQKSVWHYVDVLIRFAAGIALAPLVILVLFLAIFATDAPGSGIVFSLLIVGLGGGLIFFIYKSCRAPDSIAAKLGMFGKYNKTVARMPAYLYAPVGIYFGSRLIAGITPNLHRPEITTDDLLQGIQSPAFIFFLLLWLVVTLVKHIRN
jgi:succinate dehydrogenase hydrophobic anchor subunit